MLAAPLRASQRSSVFLLVALTVLAAAVRLPQLQADSLWFDEAATWSQVHNSFPAMLSATIRDNYPPLYNAVTWGFVQAFGDSEWVLRLPAALFGIALVPMVYLLAKQAAGRAAGHLAALLIALSAFHVWYSLEARMYSLLALTSCAYAWAALRDIDRQSRHSGLAVIGIGLALLLSHPYGAFCWLAVSGVVLFRAQRRKRTLGVLAVAPAMFLPFAVALLGRTVAFNKSGLSIPAPTPQLVLLVFVKITSGLLPVLVLCIVAAVVPSRRAPRSPALLLLLALALVPATLGYLASLLTQPVLIDRYLIGSLPAIVVLAAIGVTRWPIGRRGLLAAAEIATVFSVVTMNSGLMPHREDWRAAAKDVRAQWRRGDCVATYPSWDSQVWRYYVRGRTCFAQVHSLDPALRRVFLLVETGFLGRAGADIKHIETRMVLVRTRRFNRLLIYEFARRPLTP
jgi:mannosyltransferase